MTPVLIACSHGTSSPDGRAAISATVEKVRLPLPHISVEEAFVDVQHPEIDDVVRAVSPRPAVVVPLLLSTGFHTKVDIARAVTDAGGRATATAALGPHPLLAELLATRLHEAGLSEGDAVVLAAAGSSDPAASVDVAGMADLLRAQLDPPVSVAFAAGAGIRIGDAVAQARATGARRVVAASYALAPPLRRRHRSRRRGRRHRATGSRRRGRPHRRRALPRRRRRRRSRRLSRRRPPRESAPSCRARCSLRGI